MQLEALQGVGSESPELVEAFHWLVTGEEGSGGRFERPVNVRLRNVMEWLDFNQVVPSDVRSVSMSRWGPMTIRSQESSSACRRIPSEGEDRASTIWLLGTT